MSYKQISKFKYYQCLRLASFAWTVCVWKSRLWRHSFHFSFLSESKFPVNDFFIRFLSFFLLFSYTVFLSGSFRSYPLVLHIFLYISPRFPVLHEYFIWTLIVMFEVSCFCRVIICLCVVYVNSIARGERTQTLRENQSNGWLTE